MAVRTIARLAVTAFAAVAFVPEAAGQTAPSPFRLPSVQFEPQAQIVPPAPPQGPPVPAPQPWPAVRPRPTTPTPPPVRCTMKLIPVDPAIDAKIVRQPDKSVNYAKREVPPPACR